MNRAEGRVFTKLHHARRFSGGLYSLSKSIAATLLSKTHKNAFKIFIFFRVDDAINVFYPVARFRSVLRHRPYAVHNIVFLDFFVIIASFSVIIAFNMNYPVVLVLSSCLKTSALDVIASELNNSLKFKSNHVKTHNLF